MSFGPVVGWLAAALMLTRFFDENLTVQGYLDISYLALIVWALALEMARRAAGRWSSCCWPAPGCCAPTRGC